MIQKQVVRILDRFFIDGETDIKHKITIQPKDKFITFYHYNHLAVVFMPETGFRWPVTECTKTDVAINASIIEYLDTRIINK